MQTTKLIELLQELVDNHKPYEEVMGPHEIVIDVFKESRQVSNTFLYGGFSPDIQIHKSRDGVYDILNAFAETVGPPG